MEFIQAFSCKIRSCDKQAKEKQTMTVQLTHSTHEQHLMKHFRISSWQQGLGVESLESEKKDKVYLLGLEAWRLKHLIEPLGIPKSLISYLSMCKGLWFPVAQLCAMNPAARSLFENNPVMLWMMVYSASYRQSYVRWNITSHNYHWLKHIPDIRKRLMFFRLEDIVGNLQKKQKAIVKALTGVGSQSHVRVLKKIQLDEASSEEYFALFKLLQDQTLLKFFRHWPDIPIEYLQTFIKNPLLTQLSFLKKGIYDELDIRLTMVLPDLTKDQRPLLDVNRERLKQLASLVEDLIMMAEELGLENNARQMLRQARSVDTIIKYHNELVQKINRRNQLQRLDTYREQGWTESAPKLDDSGLPINAPPPIPGTKTIVPITTVTDLYAEGLLMGHCVASYIGKIERGEVFVYRVLAPERATVSVTVKTAGHQISEIRRADNAPVSEFTLQAVKSWLNKYNREHGDELGLIEWSEIN